jgi:hypothetical protein
MAKYVLVALNGPTPDGSAEEMERWYREVHIPDLKSVPGIKSARRYKVVKGHFPGRDPWPAIAIYEIECDDLSVLSKDMQERLRPFHPSFDRSQSAHVFAIQTAGDE